MLALSGTLVDLAGTTATLLLLVFFAINVSLVAIRRQDKDRVSGFRAPIVLPMLGAASCLVLVTFTPPKSLVTAVAIVATGIALVAICRRLPK